jgi:hypothetical protein
MTIHESLLQLPEPYNHQAIANTTVDTLSRWLPENKASKALTSAFNWNHSYEGRDYWIDFYKDLIKQEE